MPEAAPDLQTEPVTDPGGRLQDIEDPDVRRAVARLRGTKGGDVTRAQKAAQAAARAEGKAQSPKATPEVADEAQIRGRLRDIGLGRVKAGQVEVQALRALLGDEADTDAALPASVWSGVREEWLLLCLGAQDMDAALARVVQHELAKSLSTKPEA